MSDKKYSDEDVKRIVQETMNQTKAQQKPVVVKDQGIDQMRKGCGFILMIPIIMIVIFFVMILFS